MDIIGEFEEMEKKRRNPFQLPYLALHIDPESLGNFMLNLGMAFAYI
jgi:hypothetical protein